MHSSSENPIKRFIESQGVIILDGGLATALEARGHKLDDELWSAKILLESPAAIKWVHLDYLIAGADCITTASYQASLTGFSKHGFSDQEGADLLRRSISLAIEARHIFWSEHINRLSRIKPLVAASVGPYGAFLADGSEYTGRYDKDEQGLRNFHEKRWQILADSQADLLACETIPSGREAGVLLNLLRDTPGRWAWLSFSCRNGTELNDGSRLVDAVRDCDNEPQVAAVGINCTPPEHIPSLIREARKATEKPVFVYPNTGERYNPVQKTWLGRPGANWEEAVQEWKKSGAAGIGGCCRVGPQDITAMRRWLIT